MCPSQYPRKQSLTDSAHLKNVVQGKYAAAVEAYEQAIREDPTVAAYYGNRSAALLMLKKFDDAIADCKKAIGKLSILVVQFLAPSLPPLLRPTMTPSLLCDVL